MHKTQTLPSKNRYCRGNIMHKLAITSHVNRVCATMEDGIKFWRRFSILNYFYYEWQEGCRISFHATKKLASKLYYWVKKGD